MIAHSVLPEVLVVRPGGKKEATVSGRIKIRAISLALLSPWWFQWPIEGVREFFVMSLVVALSSVPLLSLVLPLHMSARIEKAVEVFVVAFVAFSLHWTATHTVILLLALLAAPGEVLFILPATMFFRTLLAIVFSVIALFGSRFANQPWYRVFGRAFEAGGRAGTELAESVRYGEVPEWLQRYGRGLLRLIVDS